MTEEEHVEGQKVAHPGRRRWGLWLFALVTLALGFGGTYAYLFVAGHEPSAHLHVPSGSNVVIRIDAIPFLTWAPVREHLWPVLLKKSFTGNKSEAESKTPLERIAEETGVSIPADLREVVLASVDGKAWVLIAAGPIEAGRFVDGVEKVLQETGVQSVHRDDELLVHKPVGAALGQADDGALVAGTTVQVTRAALPARDDDEPPELMPPLEGAIGFALNSTACGELTGGLDLRLPGVATLKHIQELSGVVTLGDEPLVTLEIVPRGVDAETLAQKLTGQTKWLSLFLPSKNATSKALGNATFEAKDDIVVAIIPMPYEWVETLIKAAAQHIEAS